MKFIIDIIVVAIIVISALIGAKKGLMKVLLPVIAFLAAVYFSYALSPVVAEQIQTKIIEPKIISGISESLNDGIKSVEESIPNFIVKNATALGIDMDELLDTAGNSSDTAERTAQKIVSDYINPVMIKAISAVSSILLFLLLSAIFNLVVKVFNKLIKASPVGPVNKIGGAVLGCLNGFVFAAAFCLLISAIVYFKGDGILFFNIKSAENSYFYNLFTNFLYK